MPNLVLPAPEPLRAAAQAIKVGDIRLVANHLRAPPEAITLPEDYNDIFGPEDLDVFV